MKMKGTFGAMTVEFNQTILPFNASLLNSSFIEMYIDPYWMQLSQHDEFDISKVNFTWKAMDV
jgi:hypothetical protein